MTTCPSCGAAEDRALEPSIRNVRNLATTDGETPAQLLARVKEMLAL